MMYATIWYIVFYVIYYYGIVGNYYTTILSFSTDAWMTTTTTITTPMSSIIQQRLQQSLSRHTSHTFISINNVLKQSHSMKQQQQQVLLSSYHDHDEYDENTDIDEIGERYNSNESYNTIRNKMYESIDTNNNNNNNIQQQINVQKKKQQIRKQKQQIMIQANYQFIQQILQDSTITTTKTTNTNKKKNQSWISIQFCGQSMGLPSSMKQSFNNNNNRRTKQTENHDNMIRCMVFQQYTINDHENDDTTIITSSSVLQQQPCLLIPMNNNNGMDMNMMTNDWWLLLQQLTNQKQWNKNQLRRQNMIIINRMNGLYDNLPYTTNWWTTLSTTTKTITSSTTTRMNNSTTMNYIDSSLLKRECYNMLTGKDWYLWNYRLNNNNNNNDVQVDNNNNDNIDYDNINHLNLQSRILLLQLQEYETKIIECDSKLESIQQQEERRNTLYTDNDDQQLMQQQEEELKQFWYNQRTQFYQLLNQTIDQYQIVQLQLQQDQSDKQRTTNNNFMNIIKNTWSDWTNTISSSKRNDSERMSLSNVSLPYQNTYEMINKLICQQYMNAEIAGIVIENMSLLDVESGMTIGGLIILRRKQNEESNNNVYGNESIYLVECHVDEAVGMSMACNLPIWIEQETYDRGKVMCQKIYENTMTSKTNSFTQWQTVDPELSILMEGQASNISTTERVLPIRIPRITNLYDSIMMASRTSSSRYDDNKNIVPKDLFPTDNIITSLADYDQLSIDGKARTLMAMSNFQQQSLPRRRTIVKNPSILDDILIPLIDESVRYEYKLRMAQQQNDVQQIQVLQEQQSKRSKLKIQAQKAQEMNNKEKQEYLENEIDFYTSLRADITQDEGTYNRFLDRDEWYERNRQKLVQRILEQEKKKGISK